MHGPALTTSVVLAAAPLRYAPTWRAYLVRLKKYQASQLLGAGGGPAAIANGNGATAHADEHAPAAAEVAAAPALEHGGLKAKARVLIVYASVTGGFRLWQPSRNQMRQQQRRLGAVGKPHD